MINPNDVDGCIFIHQEQLYQFNYDDDEDEITFYCWNTEETITATEDIVPLLLTLTTLGQAALLK